MFLLILEAIFGLLINSFGDVYVQAKIYHTNNEISKLFFTLHFHEMGRGIKIRNRYVVSTYREVFALSAY